MKDFRCSTMQTPAKVKGLKVVVRLGPNLSFVVGGPKRWVFATLVAPELRGSMRSM